MNSSIKVQEKYQTINELVTALEEEDRTQYTELIQSVKIPVSIYERYCSWSSEGYTRNCIVNNENFELIMLCWEPGQKTPIHDHGGEECWVKIIQGELKETIYEVDDAGELSAVKSSIALPGDISYMIDFMGCHRLENKSAERGMSLHLYAKPIRNCQLFDEESKEFVRKDLEYNTVFEKETY